VTFPQPIFGVSGRPVSVTSVGGLAFTSTVGSISIDINFRVLGTREREL